MKRRLAILIIILAFGTVLFLLLPNQDTGRHMPWLPDTPLVSPVRELPVPGARLLLGWRRLADGEAGTAGGLLGLGVFRPLDRIPAAPAEPLRL